MYKQRRFEYVLTGHTLKYFHPQQSGYFIIMVRHSSYYSLEIDQQNNVSTVMIRFKAVDEACFELLISE